MKSEAKLGKINVHVEAEKNINTFVENKY